MQIAGIPILKIMQISPIFDLLLACLVMLIIIAVVKWKFYQTISMDRLSFMERIKNFVVNKQYDEAIQYSTDANKPLARMVKVGLTNRNKTPEDIAELMEANRMSERVKLEKFLPIMGTLGNSAVFIGLLGTVIGIIRAFKLLESAGAAGPTAIMIGIAEALIATAMGLLVAIPCVILFNSFTERIKMFSLDMEVARKEFITMVPKKK